MLSTRQRERYTLPPTPSKKREILLLIITYFQDLVQETSFVHILVLDVSSLLKESMTKTNLI